MKILKNMKIKAFHHVAIICSNYDVSKDFYTRILGLKVLGEIYRADRQSYKLDLQLADGGQIELFSFPNPPVRPSWPEARGLRHLAFAVDDVEAAVTALTEKGIATESIRVDEWTGKKFVFFSDPDSLPLELYEVDPHHVDC